MCSLCFDIEVKTFIEAFGSIQSPELYLDLSTQRPVLHLDVSTPRVLSCTWTWLDKYPKNPVISLFTFTIILSVDLIYVLSNCPRPI